MVVEKSVVSNLEKLLVIKVLKTCVLSKNIIIKSRYYYYQINLMVMLKNGGSLKSLGYVVFTTI